MLISQVLSQTAMGNPQTEAGFATIINITRRKYGSSRTGQMLYIIIDRKRKRQSSKEITSELQEIKIKLQSH
jgi:hypothetical protein